MPDQPSQEEEDQRHLDLLATFHYVVGGFASLFGCIPLLHLGIGLSFVFGDAWGSEHPPPPFFGWIFVVMGGAMFVMAQAFAVAIILSGRQLRRRVRYMFTFIMACLACMCVPFGTVLGVFTIIVLSRPTVKRLYGVNGA